MARGEPADLPAGWMEGHAGLGLECFFLTGSTGDQGGKESATDREEREKDR